MQTLSFGLYMVSYNAFKGLSFSLGLAEICSSASGRAWGQGKLAFCSSLKICCLIKWLIFLLGCLKVIWSVELSIYAQMMVGLLYYFRDKMCFFIWGHGGWNFKVCCYLLWLHFWWGKLLAILERYLLALANINTPLSWKFWKVN